MSKNKKLLSQKTARTITVDIALLIFIYLFFKHCIGFGYATSGSMEPTIITGDIAINNKLAYKKNKPQRGDIVTFRKADENVVYAKRIIGLPGERISFANGRIYLNNECLDETTYGCPNRYTICEQEFIVPKGHYFLLGDNRWHSYDSRLWDYPYISENDILGKIIFIFHM